ncbi:MAG: DedA family protein [Candidatus Hydrogenedentota bacterium]|nr:MAG: DedA family protein [Candidatus Hydrogenedentota bacterium]
MLSELISLFSISFLSSTLLPGGSEAYIFTIRKSGIPIGIILVVATIGNTLGAFVNYALGRWFSHWLHHKLIGFKEKQLNKAEAFFRKWGGISLLFSALPIIGDPLTAIAGIFRYPISLFILLTAFGKFARYAILLWIVQKL